MLWLASALLAALLAGLAAYYYSHIHTFVPPTHAQGVHVADYSRKDLPPVVINTRVINLMSGLHFDQLLQDTPDDLRPPAIVLFEGFETCKSHDFAWFTKMAENTLPSRERLLIASYDMDANPRRSWFRFTPEMDLAARFNVTTCGTLVFVPRTCNGDTKYCIQARTAEQDPEVERVGCANFTDPCAAQTIKLEHYEQPSEALHWIVRNVKQQGEPMISPVFGSYFEQARWIRSHDASTNDNQLRNYYLAESFPAFTPLGFAASQMPKEFVQWIRAFYDRRKNTRRREYWDSQSSLISFHETPTHFVDLDLEGQARDRIANEVIKPLVEKWSGISPLELTAFYGIRIYDKNFLRSHVDRIDTHVLSVTFSLGKLNPANLDEWLTEEEESKLPTWPLEVVGFDGEIYRHTHRGGVQILYESSKLIHGRPYYNQGAPHVGCFMHFKPTNLNISQAQKWEDVTRSARANYNRNHRVGTYRSTASVEPTMPRFTSMRIGDHTGFLKADEAANSKKGNPNARDVVFHNTLSRALDLHWVQSQPGKLPMDLILQATVQPGSRAEIKTFVGHRFVWTEHDSKEMLPKGLAEIEVGRNPIYKYP